MSKKEKSRNSLEGDIQVLRTGLAIYKVNASPYYRVRIWVPAQNKYLVKSTKAISRLSAKKVAEEYFLELQQNKFVDAIPKSHLFSTYADKLIDQQMRLAEDGELHPRQATNDRNILINKNGLVSFFAKRDIRTIRSKDITSYLEYLRKDRKRKLAPSTLNKHIIALRKVLKIAHDDGIIDTVPDTPLVSRKDNPRPFFHFYPLVSKEQDEYEKLLVGAKHLASSNVAVRGIKITDELYDFILFMTHSFLRPVESEIFALQHKHVTIGEDPKRLILTIADGKTGFRKSNTLAACVSVYNRILKRQNGRNDDNYLFLPSYKNRTTASAIVRRHFNCLLNKTNLKLDEITNQTHTVYSLRHTAICMRIINSEGKVNIFNLAKTAGTSVEQIERFYARHLPLSAEMARNLQTFGDKN